MKLTHWIGVILCSCLLTTTSCTDEFSMDTLSLDNSRAEELKPVSDQNTGGLVPYTDGSEILWRANRRVPLVGKGRVVNRINSTLLSAIGTSADVTNMTDTDISNSVVFNTSLASVDLFGPIISVRDMYRTYDKGQTVGFVYRLSSEKTISLDLLKTFWIKLYKNGSEVGNYEYSESEGSLLGLSLLNYPVGENNSERVVCVQAEQEFDEVQFGTTGVGADVISVFEVLYAFVGETPEVPIVKGREPYPDASLASWPDTRDVNYSEALLEDYQNGSRDKDPNFELSLEIVGIPLIHPQMTVKLGKEIPVGTEIGFVMQSVDVANIGLLSEGLSLQTLDGKLKQVEKAGSLGLLGISLFQGSSNEQHTSMITTKPCSAVKIAFGGVSLGYTEFHYAYTREKTKVDPTSYFVIADDVTYSSSYQLPVPEKGKVEYTVTPMDGSGASTEVGISPVKKGRIINMKTEGKYQVTATYIYTHEDGTSETLVQTAVITRKYPVVESGCNTYITRESKNARIVSPEGGEGCLLCVLDASQGTPGNIIDNDPSNYITYSSAIGVAKNTALIAVESDPINPEKLSNERKLRVGFIVEADNNLLSLAALEFFYIRLYKNGEKVDQITASLNTTVGLDLISGGTANNNKMRLSGETEEEFDRIELWVGGVANVVLSRMRIYNVFYEPAENQNCSSDAAEACMELMTPVSYGLEFDSENTHLGAGLVNISGALTGLDKILDGDKNTYAIMTINNVGGGTTLSLKFDEQQGGQPIGIILGKTGSVVDAEVLNAISLKAYYKNEDNEVASAGEGSVLAADLISHGDKMYIEVTPESSKKVDRISITFGSLLNLFVNYKVYGVYIRPDKDGDGIPDCGEDDSDSGDLTVGSTRTDICEGEDIVLTKMYGGKPGTEYQLTFTGGNLTGEKTLDVLLQNACFTIPQGMHNLPAGCYYVDIKLDGAEIFNKYEVFVHPLQTTWTGKESTDWNNWNNWKEGAPWTCTDVVIPAGLTRYPELKAEDKNYCSKIQFLSGKDRTVGEVVGTQHLIYEQAWVDVTLTENKYYMLSAPLKETYTGDMFGNEYSVINDYSSCWPDLKQSLGNDFRFTPRVYQYKFGGYVNNVTSEGSEQLRPGDKNWTAPFNLVAQEYTLGTGFLIRMGGEQGDTDPVAGGKSYCMRFPKLYAEYDYYNVQTGEIMDGKRENIERTTADIGRFIYEGADNSVVFPLNVLLQNDRPGDSYLAGNPFMSHIGIKEFFEANASVGCIRLLRTNNTYTNILRSDALNGTSKITQIEPLEAFVVVLRSPYSETSRYKTYVHFTEGMQQQKSKN